MICLSHESDDPAAYLRCDAPSFRGRLSVEQWRDAFRAGRYGPEASSRFITRIRQKIA